MGIINSLGGLSDVESIGKRKSSCWCSSTSKASEQELKAVEHAGAPRSRSGKLAFIFTEEADGLKLSPYTVMVICLMYIGAVVLLHILGKMKGGSGGSVSTGPIPDPDPAADGD